MDGRELIKYLNENEIDVTVSNGRLRAVSRLGDPEKVKIVAADIAKYARLLALRARGCYKDWQGHERKLRDECPERHCPTCEHWNLEFGRDGRPTGLCVSKIEKEIKLKNNFDVYRL